MDRGRPGAGRVRRCRAGPGGRGRGAAARRRSGRWSSGRFYGSEERSLCWWPTGRRWCSRRRHSSQAGRRRCRTSRCPGGSVVDPRLHRGSRVGRPGRTPVRHRGRWASPTLLSVDAETGDLVGLRRRGGGRGPGDATSSPTRPGLTWCWRDAAGSPATLSRVDPEEGEAAWEQHPAGPGEVGALCAGPDQAVVSRVGRDPVRLAEMATGGGSTGRRSRRTPSTTARPPGPTRPARRPGHRRDGAGDGQRDRGDVPAGGPRTGPGYDERVVALDADGATRWSRDLGRGFWDGRPVGRPAGRAGAGPGVVVRCCAH